MQATIVYLIRHSIPESTVKDGKRLMYGPPSPLSEEGKQKAAKLGEELLAREGQPFDAIYSSPFQRAYQTACIVAEKMSIGPVIIHPGLQDTDSEWAGTPIEELSQITRAGLLFSDPRTHETIDQIAARMTGAFHQIVSAHTGQRIGVVSHGDPLRILYYRLRHPKEEFPHYTQLVRELTLDVAQALRLEILPESDGKAYLLKE